MALKSIIALVAVLFAMGIWFITIPEWHRIERECNAQGGDLAHDSAKHLICRTPTGDHPA